MSLFFINQATYLEDSRPFRAFITEMWKNLGLSLHSKKQKLSQIQKNAE